MTLPQIPFGDVHLSRLILGANPINGGSHLSRFVNNQMKRYFTPAQVQATLAQCQAAGINTWQSGLGNLAAYRAYIDAGGEMHYIALSHAADDQYTPDKKGDRERSEGNAYPVVSRRSGRERPRAEKKFKERDHPQPYPL